MSETKSPAIAQSEVTTATALLCGSFLAAEVIMRMPSSAISKDVGGNILTRTTLTTTAMTALTNELNKTV